MHTCMHTSTSHTHTCTHTHTYAHTHTNTHTHKKKTQGIIMCRELAKSCVWWLGLSKQTKSRIAIGYISEKERALQSTSAQTSAVYQDGRVPLAVCWKWFFKRNVISSYWSSITFLDESRHLMQTATPAVIRFVIFNILSSLVIKSQRSCFNQTMVPSSTLGISLSFSDFLFHIPFFSLFFSPFFFFLLALHLCIQEIWVFLPE